MKNKHEKQQKNLIFYRSPGGQLSPDYPFSPRYILLATLTGVVLAAGYVIYQRRRRWEEAAWAIILVHFTSNSIALIVNLLL